MKAMHSTVLCFVFPLLGIIRLSQALTCSKTTDNTCTKSLYVTGQCVAGVCECVGDTVPTGVGCHNATFKPTVSGNFPSGYGSVEDVDWSGEAEGNYMKFKCHPDTFEDGSYNWFLNGAAMGNSHNKEVTRYLGPGTTGRIQCSISTHGSDTEKSDAFVMTVKNNGARFTKKPKVSGIPTRAANNSDLRLSCVNIPSFLGQFVYKVNGVEQKTLHHERSQYVKMTEDMFNVPITCAVDPEDSTPTITSDTYMTPAAPSDVLPDVVIKGDNHFYENDRFIRLTCEFVESFAPGDKVTYTWTGPNPSYDTSSMTADQYFKLDTELRDAGAYSCTVSYKSQTKTSPNFEVKVEELGVYSITPQPEKPVIGGYMSLKCDTFGKKLSSTTYKWDFLVAHTDNVVQFNDIKTADFGKYVRCGTESRNVYGHVQYIPPPLPMSDAIHPVMEVSSETFTPDEYVIKCKSEYHTPGAIIEWFVDDVMQFNESSTTFKYSQPINESAKAVMCRLSFDSKKSGSSNVCTIPGNGDLATPVIQFRDSPTVFISGAGYVPRCSCLQYTDGSYQWKKNGVPMPSGSFSQLWQSVDNTTSANYTCTYQSAKTGETKESEPFELIVVDQLPTPKIEIVASPKHHVTEDGALLQTGETYYLLCSSPAHNELARYNWKKGSKSWMGIPDNMLRLHDVKHYDRNTYRCTMDLAGKSVESSPFQVTIGDVPDPATTTEKTAGDGASSIFSGRDVRSYILALFLVALNLSLMNRLSS